ncbi:MAG: cation transporter, partial [Endomicrobiaceae bacterium]|nr:cation transporter [Endomicrobiaceae bacterium]
MKTVKKQYLLEGFNCANCADKIKAEIAGLPGMVKADIDLLSQILFIETQNYEETTEKLIKQIVAKYEPAVNVKENISAAEKKVIYLANLSCADCANKIENKIREIKEIKSANVDFVSQKLSVEIYDKQTMPSVLKEIVRAVNDTDPGVSVSFRDLNKDKTNPELINKNIKIRIALSLTLFLSALIFNFPKYLEFGLFFISYLLAGGDVLLRAVNNIRKGNVFDENFLMGIATIGAFAIGEYPEGVAVMLFYQTGEIFQNIAVNRSRKSISALMDIRPDYANLKTEEGIEKVDPEEVSIDDIIVV